MKIVSRPKPVEVDIVVDMPELDDTMPVVAVPEATDDQVEFEFYSEDWVIQGAIRMGCTAQFDPLRELWSIEYQGIEVAKVTTCIIQSGGDVLLDYLRDMIGYIIQHPNEPYPI